MQELNSHKKTIKCTKLKDFIASSPIIDVWVQCEANSSW